MIVLQAGLGLANDFAGLLFAIAVALGIIYYTVLPGYFFLKQTKAWSARKRWASAFSYIILFSVATCVFWVLPDYYMTNHSVDIIGSWYHRLSMYIFFALPLVYASIVTALKLATRRKKVIENF